MIAAHQTMLAPPALPYDAEVEWLESTGTQYVDTGMGVTADTRIVARWTQVGVGVNQRLFGMNDGNPENLSLYINGGGAWALALGTSAFQLLPSAEVGDCTIDANLATGVYSFANGTRTASGTATSTPFSSTNIIPIFARNTLGTIAYADYPSTMRLAGFAIYHGSVLVRDFAPVRVGSGSSAVGYLYDVANPTGGPLGNGLYGSATSTPLVAGPDK